MRKLLIALMAFGSVSVFAQKTYCEKMLNHLRDASKTVGQVETEVRIAQEKDSRYTKAFEDVLEMAVENEASHADYVIKNCLK